MDNLTLRQITEAIEKNKTIGIVTAKNPSVDDMAAALSLYLSLKNAGKDVTIATPENPLVEVSSLVGIDKVQTSLNSAAGDLVVSFPYEEGEIDKVSYTLDNGYLNIVVKAGEKGLSFKDEEVQFTRGAKGVPTLLFTVGVQRLSDVAKLFDVADLKDTMVINIDNEADNQGFGDIVMVYPMLSSLSEQITNLLLAVNLKIDPDTAQNLMYGISDGTNNFQNPKTSALAFEMAGILMRNGAIRVNTSRKEEKNVDPFFKPQQQRQQQQSQQQRQQELQSELKKQENRAQNKDDDDSPPDDWLAPKIYKGSTNF